MPPTTTIPNALPPDAGEVERLAHLLAGGMARIGLHAFTPGERDLRMGPTLLARLVKQYKLPVVSANLTDQTGRLLFPASRIITVAGQKVGIFGVTAPQVADAKEWEGWKVKAQEPEAAARREIAALRDQGATLVIGLLHLLNMADAQRLVSTLPGLDFGVLGHDGSSLEEPQLVGQARLVEAASMGKHIGRLDLHVIASGAPVKIDGKLQLTDRGKRAQAITMRFDHQRQLDDYRNKLATEKGGAVEFFKKRVKELEEALVRDEQAIKAMPPRITGSWFENRIVPLDTGSNDHPALAMLVGEHNAESQRRAAANKPVGIKPRFPNQPQPAPRGRTPSATPAPQAALQYAGSFACKACHEPAMTAWLSTRHAHALDSLKAKKRDGDPNCVGCHVTGYMRPGGTTDVKVATARLRDVGCEACHGPGAEHAAAPSKANVKRKVEAAVCLGCHTPDQTQGDFDYAAFLKAVLVPGHGQPAVPPAAPAAQK